MELISKQSDQSVVKNVSNIARRAGEAILECKKTGLDPSAKEDGSPLTKADLAANACIMSGLQSLFELPILSEEALIPWNVRSKWNEYWLVDPLDGTKDFIKGTGDYTVNIALIKNNKPVWGVVFSPEKNEMFYGGSGFGAFKNGSPICVSGKQTNLTAVESHFHNSGENAEFYQKFNIENISKVGSSLKFCMIASGSADVYLRQGPTSEWDTAAGQAVLEGAGGAVVTWPDLKPLHYNSKENLLNPNFLVFGSQKISVFES